MTSYRVWLPFPPSVNNLFAHANVRGKVRRFPTKRYKAWRKEAWVYIKSARLPRLEGPVAVRITLTPPSSTRRDVDNYNKAILDALVEARVITDDSQVQRLLSVWEHEREKPGAIVEIGSFTQERPPLTTSERAALTRLRRAGPKLVGPDARAPEFKSLVAKGYVREIPGLIEGVPQGYAIAD